MSPDVGDNGELILNASGKKSGEPGFYFLLNDSKDNYWSQYIASFRDSLTVNRENGYISATQVLTLWKQKLLQFTYRIELKP